MRNQIYSGVYSCPVCDDEFELVRACGLEMECPDCGELLQPTVTDQEVPPESTGNAVNSGPRSQTGVVARGQGWCPGKGWAGSGGQSL